MRATTAQQTLALYADKDRKILPYSLSVSLSFSVCQRHVVYAVSISYVYGFDERDRRHILRDATRA